MSNLSNNFRYTKKLEDLLKESTHNYKYELINNNYYFYDDIPRYYRAALWELSDYKVSSVSGGMIILVKQ